MGDAIDMDEEMLYYHEQVLNMEIGENDDNELDIVDHTNAYITDKVFQTRDDLLKWVKDIGRERGTILNIFRSENATQKRGMKNKLLIGCKRSGSYKSWNPKPVRNSGTKKCQCPFRLRGKMVVGGDGWTVNMVCGVHNHDVYDDLHGHAYAGRLDPEERNLLEEMTKNLVKPKLILVTLKRNNADNLTSIRLIYNYRQAYRKVQRGDRSEMQQLISLMERDNYVYRVNQIDDSGVVNDIFWAHPDSLNLANTFHYVFMIDSTYKTCRHGLPLLEIVGVTPTGKTFSVAYAYLDNEKINNFRWALNMLKEQMLGIDICVIITDREQALMNAVSEVFPTTIGLLCTFHIAKNVKARCKKFVFPKEKQDPIYQAWEDYMYCMDLSEIGAMFEKFRCSAVGCSMFYNYVMDTWLEPYKKKFVAAYTNRYLHLGETTTNRVESAHATLKNLLLDSRGDFCSVWEAISACLKIQHKEIRDTFQKSMYVVNHRHNTPLYAKLCGFVLRKSMELIATEYKRVKNVGIDQSKCGCTHITTLGLPCACELARYSMTPSPIPLDAVHIFWRIVTFSNETFTYSSELSIRPMVDLILHRFEQLELPGKMVMHSKLKEITMPHTTQLVPPLSKVKTEGAPKKNTKIKRNKCDNSTKREKSWWERVDDTFGCSGKRHTSTQSSVHKIERPIQLPFMHFIPYEMHKFVVDVVDVNADGNCGYHAIGALLGRTEESWPQIRQELISELNQWYLEYTTLFGGRDQVKKWIDSLTVVGNAEMYNWMTLPEMGPVIASRFNVCFVSLSTHMSLTYFPLRGTPPHDHTCIAVCFVNNCHWVQVYLRHDSPIPTPAYMWRKYCHPEALVWDSLYNDRIQQWRVMYLTVDANLIEIDLDD